jgi:hypothetical protein
MVSSFLKCEGLNVAPSIAVGRSPNSPGADERSGEPIGGKRFAAPTFSSKAAVLNREQSTKLQTVV